MVVRIIFNFVDILRCHRAKKNETIPWLYQVFLLYFIIYFHFVMLLKQLGSIGFRFRFDFQFQFENIIFSYAFEN